MAVTVYNEFKRRLMDGDVDLVAAAVKVLLLEAGYTANADHQFADQGGGADVVDAEISGTGYVGGWGGSGRKALASKTVTKDNSIDRAVFDAADLVWSLIDAGTVVAAVIVLEGVSDDTDTLLVAHFPFSAVVTDGGNLTLQWNVGGILAL
jgi:hypothetical protein